MIFIRICLVCFVCANRFWKVSLKKFSSINVKSSSTIPLSIEFCKVFHDQRLEILIVFITHIIFQCFLCFQKSFKLNQNKSQKMLDFSNEKPAKTLCNNTIVNISFMCISGSCTNNNHQQLSATTTYFSFFIFHSSHFNTLGAVCITQLYLRSPVNWFSLCAVANSYVLFYYYYFCFFSLKEIVFILIFTRKEKTK